MKLEGELDAGRYGGVLQARGARRRARRRLSATTASTTCKQVTHKIALGQLHAALRADARGRRLDDPGGAGMSEFYGKYRGKVENNVDPLQQGRVQVSVPAVLGDGQLELGDAVRAVRRPAGRASSRSRRSDANVWVEFEAGDPDYPIWSRLLLGHGRGARRRPRWPRSRCSRPTRSRSSSATSRAPAASRSRSSRPPCRRRSSSSCTSSGIELSQRPPSVKLDARPASREQRRPGGDLMAGAALPRRRPGDVPARRPGHDRPGQPAGARRRPAGGDDGRHVHGRRLRLHGAARRSRSRASRCSGSCRRRAC